MAIKSGSFCLINFDMAQFKILDRNSAFTPQLNLNWSWRKNEMAMCFSVAQIAVNVFLLSGFSSFALSVVDKAEVGVSRFVLE